MVARKTPDHSG